jgi:choline dehydrogenase
MKLTSNSCDIKTCYDYIIVGGGTAGCALASRLSQKFSVLIIEMGLDLECGLKYESIDPFSNLYQKTINLSNVDQPIAGIGINMIYNPMTLNRYQGLGGLSIGSDQVLLRGSSSEWDTIAAQTGYASYNWGNVVPFFNQTETVKLVNNEGRGHDGPMIIQNKLPQTPQFLNVINEFNSKINSTYITDYNLGTLLGPNNTPGISEAQLITTKFSQINAGGARETTYARYILNLEAEVDILQSNFVEKIIFDSNKNATHVQLCSTKKMIQANKEIILSAGALKSPELLLKSGIGPAADLNLLGIPIVQDSQRVGKNLTDRIYMGDVYFDDLTEYPDGYIPPMIMLNSQSATPLFGTVSKLEYVGIPSQNPQPEFKYGIPEGFSSIFNYTQVNSNGVPIGWFINPNYPQGSSMNIIVGPDPSGAAPNGILSIGQDVNLQGGLLQTLENFGDFEFYCEVKLDFYTDGGIFLRASPQDGSAYQSTLDYRRFTSNPLTTFSNDGSIGKIFGEFPFPNNATLTLQSNKWKDIFVPDNWNSILIRMENNERPRIKVWINSILITNFEDVINRGLPLGGIGLQVHSSSSRWIQGNFQRFRNLSVRRGIGSDPIPQPIKYRIQWNFKTYLINSSTSGTVTLRNSGVSFLPNYNFPTSPNTSVQIASINVSTILRGMLTSTFLFYNGPKSTLLLLQGDTIERFSYIANFYNFERGNRLNANTFCGTCALGSSISTGVVNDNGLVFGVNRLRICDSSILPQITYTFNNVNTTGPISSHFQGPPMMLAEKISEGILNPPIEEYDYIIAGSGCAGTILASRLSEDPNLKILLLESGPDINGINNDPNINLLTPETVEAPINYDKNIIQKDPIDPQHYMVTPFILGGGSSINGQAIVRPDKNYWRTISEQYNLKGWLWEDVLPYFEKMETYIPCLNPDPFSGDCSIHGITGPMQTNRGTPTTPANVVNTASVANLTDLAALFGLPYEIEMQNGFLHKMTNYQYNVYRVVFAYLINNGAIRRPNLTIKLNSEVSKIHFHDGNSKNCSSRKKLKKVTGIETCNGSMYRASKEYILNLGAINTPRILQLSGIGPKKTLERAGICCRHQLEGVGRNLFDHIGIPHFPLITYTFRIPFTGFTGAQYWIGYNTGLYPEDTLDIQLTTNIAQISENIYNVLCRPFIQKHHIRGTVKVLSSDPNIRPDLKGVYDITDKHGNFHPEIRQQLIRLYRKFESIYNTPGISFQFPFNVNLYTVEFLSGLTDDQIIEIYRTAFSALNGQDQNMDNIHYAGSCRMGPESDCYAVVNDQFQVYGFSNLRISDCSILPDVPTGHMSINGYMFGEKLSDIIKSSL